jgi:S1-C subfamily serine protease
VLHTLETAQMPSVASARRGGTTVGRPRDRAGLEPEPGEGNSPSSRGGYSIGTGVVIVDKGSSLTNLHVVANAEQVKVEFFDGLVSVMPQACWARGGPGRIASQDHSG